MGKNYLAAAAIMIVGVWLVFALGHFIPTRAWYFVPTLVSAGLAVYWGFVAALLWERT